MIRGIKGVKDTLPDEMPRWQVIEGAARRFSHLYGFREIRVPVFEVTELFARSIGASTDIVEKEMYTFQDRDGSSLTLRPEATAGVVRAYIEHNLTAAPTAQKFYYLGPMFRHERPQAGRLRQFHQYGVESFGSAAPQADVEVISLLWRFLSSLGLPGLTLELNSLGEAGDRPAYKAALVAFLKPLEDKLCQNCRRRIETNPLRVLDCKVPACRTATDSAPKLTDHLSPFARQHFETVRATLDGLRIPYLLNPRLVRGLDYYTLTTFEVTTTHLGAQNAVGAGGRYDGLVEVLGGPKTPAVGFAVGLERVSLMLPEGSLPAAAKTVFVAGFGSQGLEAGVRLLDELRFLGVPADTDFRASSLKALLRQADRLQASYCAILGDDEVGKGSLILRDMQTKEQQLIPLGKAAPTIASLFLKPQ
ncbi:MAG: histidine--tRNA ligase [Nitrospirae bacterium]|nr:MAG: histidine--tRNA ligase [Nitrospirota bacterium]